VGARAPEDDKKIGSLIYRGLEYRRSQGVQWVHVHPRARKKWEFNLEGFRV